MAALQYKEYGTVKKIRGCIVTVEGLENCINGQLVKFGYGTEGTVIGFDPVETDVLLLKEKEKITTGDRAIMTMEAFNFPVGNNFLGRIVNVLAEPMDNLGPIKEDEYRPIFFDAPSVLERKVVKGTLETGVKILDAMIPIGRGQRQLVLGDKMTGKTTIGTDIMINQKGKDVVCIYCCIGKGKAALDRVVNLFKKHDVFDYSIVVAAIAGTSPGQQYLAPYVSCALGEYFMYNGGHVVVVFDDFTKHAWSYREISLLLGRPPGRESYPGDVFYLHSQMIERAAQLNDDFGGGSMTFFPIIELLEGDLTGYVSTNLVSMTDGQIYLSSALFGENFRPAIDIGLSVSRIGSKVQWKGMKKLAASLRLEYLQFREMMKISRLKAGGQSEEAVEQMKGGELLSQLLVQPSDSPLDMVEEVILFFGLARKLIYDLDNDQIPQLKEGVFPFAKEHYPELIKKIREVQDLNEDIEEELEALYEKYIQILQKKKLEKEQAMDAEDDLPPE